MITVKHNKNPNNERVVVLFSGGLDSTVCLGLACQAYRPSNVYPLLFDYGQRHRIELDQAKRIAAMLRTARAMTLPVDALRVLGGSALTDGDVPVEASATRAGGNAYAAQRGLPSTFVPGRNLVFLSLAAAYAATLGANTIMTGVCEADAAGYPDCRRSFVEAANKAVSQALGEALVVDAPLLHMNKASTFALAESLGILDLVVEETQTCYRGERGGEHKHDWGHGCARCPACLERERGWAAYVALKQAYATSAASSSEEGASA